MGEPVWEEDRMSDSAEEIVEAARQATISCADILNPMNPNAADRVIAILLARHAAGISVCSDHTIQSVIQIVSDDAVGMAMEMADSLRADIAEQNG